jgi:hypothetical protein
MHFQGEVDNKLIEENNVDFDFIGSFLKQMNQETSSYCVLSLNDSCYIQCAGSSKKLTIEWRNSIDSGFRHYVIGRKQLVKTKRKLKYSAGEIDIMSNELLTYEDALVLFKSFMEHHDLLSLQYSVRETTKMFV